MDKHKKKSLKIFEEDSADESIEDPYHDDGEYGSDQDYDPSSQDAGSCSSSEVLTSLQRKRPRNNSRRTKKKAKTSPTNNRSAIRPSDSSNGSSSSSESSSDDSGSSDRDDGSGCGSAGAVSSDENMGEESPSTKLPPEENQDSSDSSEIFPLAERIKKSYYSKHADYLFDSPENRLGLINLIRLSQMRVRKKLHTALKIVQNLMITNYVNLKLKSGLSLHQLPKCLLLSKVKRHFNKVF
ncbi:hypothetical protein O0L34_g11628 [Tuta absoluta]|nr:hypothetical protein O0L34_g11628 [Tuta absoluta]